MGKIKKILENELIGGTQSTDVYPVTSTKAVYNEDNENLDSILNSITEKLNTKVNTSAIVQQTGDSTTSVMSQKAISDELSSKVNTSDVVQQTGDSTTSVMSQKAVTENLMIYDAGTLTQISNGTDDDYKLAAINSVPSSLKKGGLTVLYTPYGGTEKISIFLNSSSWSSSASDWQGIDEEPNINSRNLINSSGVYNALHKVEIVTLSVDPTKIATDGRIGSNGLFVRASGYGIRTFSTKLQAGLYKLTYSAVGANSINTVALYKTVVKYSSNLTSENLIKVIDYTETPKGTEYIVEFEVLEGEEGYLSFSFYNNAKPTSTVYGIEITDLLNFLQEQINNKLPYSFRRYLEGGYSVTNTPSLVDKKIAATLYSIIKAQPDADIYVVDNYNGGYNNWSSPNRTYANELKAFADWFCIGFLSLKDSGIRERVSGQRRTFTADGLHAYTEAGATRIYNRIIGQLLQRYACDIQNIINKKILLLGDSTSIVGNPTSWAKMLNDVCSNVTNMSMGGTGWIDNNEGGGRNVLEQFNAAPSDNYDIIIISSGFNELHQFNLDYASTIEYCSNNYQEWG